MSLLQSIKSFRITWLWLILVFLFSGLIINCIQILMLPLWYISRQSFRYINATLCYFHWSSLTFLGEWWGHIDIKFYGNKEDFDLIGKEHALVLPNHRSDIDWLIGWIIAERTGILGGAKCYMKNYLKYLPVIGWMWWCAEYVFLKRSWDSDLPVLEKSLKQLADFPLPFFLGIFPEGTRFTKAKHANSVEFAKSRGLPQLQYHLFPRTKGVAVTLKYLSNVVSAVYDIEAAYSGNSKATVLNLLSGGQCEAHVLIKRIPIKKIPHNSYEDVSTWCQNLFVEKDKDMSYFVQNGFYNYPEVNLPRRKRNLIIVLFWNILLMYPTLSGLIFILRSSIIISVPLLVTMLVTAFIMVRILLHFSDTKKGSKFGLEQNGNNYKQSKQEKIK